MAVETSELMSVVYGLDSVSVNPERSAVALGVFDAVHWGHRAIFTKLLDVAGKTGLTSKVLTFDKSPTELLAPERAPHYITTLEQRVELIAAIGVEEVIVVEFDRAFAELEPEEFLGGVLGRRLNAGAVIVGSNFRFGKGRTGDIRYLAARIGEIRSQLHVVPSVIVDGAPVSSTRVRSLVSAGSVEAASALLGRHFTLRGVVVQGRQVGRSIGFPTANIQCERRQQLPAKGVYIVQCIVDGTRYDGLCNVGTNPTFGLDTLSVEVHLSAFEGNLYGKTLDVGFVRRLRSEMVFDSPDKLVEQIRQDLGQLGAAPGPGAQSKVGPESSSG